MISKYGTIYFAKHKKQKTSKFKHEEEYKYKHSFTFGSVIFYNNNLFESISF